MNRHLHVANAADSGEEVHAGIHAHINAVKRSDERQRESIETCNDRIKDKERQHETSLGQDNKAISANGGGGNGATPDPHEPDWTALYWQSYSVDDVRGGEMEKCRIIEARKL